MKADELVKKCEEELKVGWNLWKFIKLAWYSFRGDFEKIKGNIQFKLEEEELDRFIEVCDNRIERAKTMLNETAVMLGFVITGIAIILSFSSEVLKQVPEQDRAVGPIRALLFAGDVFFQIFVVFLIVCLILLLILLGHYRIHIHAWTAFKEGAVLNKKH